LNSIEQRELLKLLTQNFEFEMKTLELQADIFVRDYSIKHKDLQLLRMSQHRSLCDTLIYQQRRLIQGKNNNLDVLKNIYLNIELLMHILKVFLKRLFFLL